MKRCSRCNLVKPMDDFYRQSKSKDGRAFYCKPCDKSAPRNTNKIASRKRTYAKTHSVTLSQRTRTWRKANPERAKEITASWRRLHPEYQEIRRGRIGYTRIKYKDVLARDGFWCYLCQRDVDPNDVHIDHKLPVSRGGTTTMENLAVTHSKCNMSKGARTPEEYWAFIDAID